MDFKIKSTHYLDTPYTAGKAGIPRPSQDVDISLQAVSIPRLLGLSAKGSPHIHKHTNKQTDSE